MADKATDFPNYKHPDLIAVEKDLALMDDLLSGTRRMHKRASAYIRKWADEEMAVYNIRSKSEQLFEGTSRTLSAAVGMIFAKAPTLEWNGGEGTIEEHWENIDAGGTKGHVFVKRFTDFSIRDGVGLILVDHPPKPTDPETEEPIVVSEQEVMDYDLRPRWTCYGRHQILSWRTERIKNRLKVVQVVLHEPTPEADGIYGIVVRERFRVLRIIDNTAVWELFEKIGDKGDVKKDFKLVASGVFRNKGGKVYSELPIAVAHTGRSDKIMTSTIPLLPVANANLAHYQIATNLRFYTDLLAFPQPTVTGELALQKNSDGSTSPGQLKVGPLVTIHLTGQNPSYSFVSPDPGSFEPLQKAVKEREWQMSQLGMSFLASDTRQAETAEAKRLDATAENATLATAAQGIDDAVNTAFRHHAWFEGIEEEDALPKFALNRDFESTAMDAQTMVAYITAVEKAGLPPDLLLQAWQAGGRIPPDVDIEDLMMEMLANQAAKEEREREEREAQMAALQGGNAAPGQKPPGQEAVEGDEGA